MASASFIGSSWVKSEYEDTPSHEHCQLFLEEVFSATIELSLPGKFSIRDGEIPFAAHPMKYLWSPWRMAYIQKHNQEQGCVFCEALGMTDGLDNLILYRGQESFVILNRYPYTSGHLMVVPYKHDSSLDGLDADTRAELIELAAHIMTVLGKEYHAEGFNMGVNVGEAAGAGIVEHVHLHVVPRWTGDTNFMSSLGETRVLPETLEETYQRLKQAWE